MPSFTVYKGQAKVIGTPRSDRDYIIVQDARTGKSYRFPIIDGTVHAARFAEIRSTHGRPLRMFDPGYMNTIVCRTAISSIDGPRGILLYRGHRIEALVGRTTFLDIAHLLIFGHFPPRARYLDWRSKVLFHARLPETVLGVLRTMDRSAHPMALASAAMMALAGHYTDTSMALHGLDLYDQNPHLLNTHICIALGSALGVAANVYRRRAGMQLVAPHTSLDFAEEFLWMVDGDPSAGSLHTPIVRLLDTLLVLHAEHGTNCSTAALRHAVSARSDLFSALGAAIGSLGGPRHGGANQKVIEMLDQIPDVAAIPEFLERVKRKECLLYGFGHRVYTNYDPRARIVQQAMRKALSVLGDQPKLAIALALEAAALRDPYFRSRKLFPNVDFYTGILYRALGFPPAYFTILFFLPRVAGWLAHWRESILATGLESKLYRPLSLYTPKRTEPFVPLEERLAGGPATVPTVPRGAELRRPLWRAGSHTAIRPRM